MEAPNKEEQQARLDAFCKELMTYFLPGSVTFGLPGPPQQSQSVEHNAAQLKMMLQRYLDFQGGVEGELQSFNVNLLFDFDRFGACLIDVIWHGKPHAKRSFQPWDIPPVYGYRKLPTGEEGWESAYLDGEIAGLMTDVGPKFFQGMGL